MKHLLIVAQAAGAGGLLGSFLPLILIMGLMYVLMIRPQRKKEKALREQINAMQVGDNIVTIGGIVGKIVNMQEDEVTIATSVSNTLMTFKKNAVNTVMRQGQAVTGQASSSQASTDEEEKPKGFFQKMLGNVDKDDDGRAGG